MLSLLFAALRCFRPIILPTIGKAVSKSLSSVSLSSQANSEIALHICSSSRGGTSISLTADTAPPHLLLVPLSLFAFSSRLTTFATSRVFIVVVTCFTTILTPFGVRSLVWSTSSVM